MAGGTHIPFEVPGLGPGLDSPKTGGNNAADDFAALQAVITAYNTANPGTQLPTPVLAGNGTGTGGQNNTGLSGFDYAVVHYGTGPGGANSGGGLEVWALE